MNAKSVTLRYESEYLNLESGGIVSSDGSDGPDADWTVRLAYDAGSAPHTRVMQNQSAGVETARLEDTSFASVGPDDAAAAPWTDGVIDKGFDGSVVVLIRTGGLVYKLGNPVDSTESHSVTLDYLEIGSDTAAGITALEMAQLLRGPFERGLDDAARGLVAGWPEQSATELGHVLKNSSVFPATTRDALGTALLGAGFKRAQVDAALADLYEPPTLGYRTAGPAGERGPDSWSDWPEAEDKGSITVVVVRHGDIVDNIQVNYGAEEFAAHGGTGGVPSSVVLDPGDVLTEVYGATGTWFGADTVLQVGFKSRAGKTFGPFGTMRFARTQTMFHFAAQDDEELIALHGSYRPGVRASGQQTFFMNGLGAVFKSESADAGVGAGAGADDILALFAASTETVAGSDSIRADRSWAIAFSVSAATTVVGGTVEVQRESGGSGLTLSITGDSGTGQPSELVLGNVTVPESSIPSNYDSIAFDLPKAVDLVAGSYHLVLRTTGAAEYGWRVYEGGSGGHLHFRKESGPWEDMGMKYNWPFSISGHVT